MGRESCPAMSFPRAIATIRDTPWGLDGTLPGRRTVPDRPRRSPENGGREILHVFLKSFDRAMHPGMGQVGHAVKLQHGNAARLGLVDGPLEIVERPIRTGIASRGNQQRMIEPRLVGEALSLLVRKLGSPPRRANLNPAISGSARPPDRCRCRIGETVVRGKPNSAQRSLIASTCSLNARGSCG